MTGKALIIFFSLTCNAHDCVTNPNRRHSLPSAAFFAVNIPKKLNLLLTTVWTVSVRSISHPDVAFALKRRLTHWPSLLYNQLFFWTGIWPCREGNPARDRKKKVGVGGEAQTATLFCQKGTRKKDGCFFFFHPFLSLSGWDSSFLLPKNRFLLFFFHP